MLTAAAVIGSRSDMCDVMINRNWKYMVIGYFQEVLNNETFVVEHINRVKKGSNLKWKDYPAKKDVYSPWNLSKYSFVITVLGEWDVLADRNMTFTQQNHECINQKFLDLATLLYR